MRLGTLGLVAAIVSIVVFAIPVTSSASPAPALVLAASASPSAIAPSGATVAVRGRVANASTCQLVVLSSQSFPVVYSHDPRSCSGGSFSAHVTIGPNPTAVARTVAFALVARNANSVYIGHFYLRLGPMPAPAVLAARAAPEAIPGSGATVTVTGKTAHATSCQLVVLSSQSFPVVYSHDPRSCSGGSFSAHVTIGPNPTAVARTVAFALVARNRAASFLGRFYVRLAAASRTSPRAPAPGQRAATVPSASAEPALTPSAQVFQQYSSNWSGWAAVGGTFTVATGTFTLPTTVRGTAGPSQLSEWVGLDGLSNGDNSLIQAGVDAVPDATSAEGFDLQPWWEILPAQETNINNLNVSPGDTVTVTIWQVSGTTWEINLTDETNGQSFTSPPETYTGTGSSAEWVVEAATQCQVSCATSQLASYNPPVTFSRLGLTGPQPTSFEQITMVQQGLQVATPSTLASGGFTVTYTGP